jgi:hypothetical protein
MKFKRMGLVLTTVYALSIASKIFADAPLPTTQPAKTGEFDITFTQRSPQSDYAKLIARIGLAKEKLSPDYDLSQEPLVIYVPKNYDPKIPVGIIVEIFQDGSPNIYQPIRPILDEQHLIMIATHKDHRPLLNAVGLCFDAVFNLTQTYTIDKSRIYFMGLGQTEEPIGWSTGDLFLGDVYIWWVGFNRPLYNNPALFDVDPPPALMRQAKAHTQILAFPAESPNAWWQGTVASTMRNDGFDCVIVAPVGHDQILRPDWFRRTLEQLQAVKSRPPVAAQSTTAPSTPDEAARLLHLAQAFIASGNTDLAKDKLNQLIEKYPNDPAAAEARKVLSQLNGQ